MVAFRHGTDQRDINTFALLGNEAGPLQAALLSIVQDETTLMQPTIIQAGSGV